MVQKFKDAASILKAKLKQDDLEESLVQATSQQNWQTPTNILHDICNAAYNYQKWQKISEFIWDKLKKKNSWRKILKTLNLVQFLIKNGPPNTITTFKYELYQFKSLQGFSHYSDNMDRGQPIRQRSKSIVELLSNDELLEEERVKAKTIRERMSGSGSVGTGGNIGGSKYEGYNSKNYKNNPTSYTGGNIAGIGSTAYGDYTVHESTLSKYKDKNEVKNKGVTPATNIPDITGLGGPSITTTDPATKIVEEQKPSIVMEQKKPFEKEAKKLRKPGAPSPVVTAPKVQSKPAVVSQQTSNQASILDDDFLGITEQAPQSTVQQNKFTVETSQSVNYINPMYSTTAQMAANNTQNQPQPQSQPQYQQPQPVQQNNSQNQSMGQNYGQNFNQQYSQAANNSHFMVNPMYGTTAPMAAQQNNQTNWNQPQNQNWNQPQMNWNQPPQQNIGYNQPQQNLGYGQPQQNIGYYQPQQNMGYGQPQQQNMSINQSYNQSTPQNQGFSLQTNQYNQNESNQNGQKPAQQANNNVKWLSSEEKGLIDFSDFGSSASTSKKQTTGSSKNQTGNNIQIDTWNW